MCHIPISHQIQRMAEHKHTRTHMLTNKSGPQKTTHQLYGKFSPVPDDSIQCCNTPVVDIYALVFNHEINLSH